MIQANTRSELLPVRMLNEYAYCPRLFYLMHVDGRWEDNVYTVEGKNVHRRVDQLDHVLPDLDGTASSGPASEDAAERTPPPGDEPPTISRSVSLGSEELGITGKLDLVATANGEAVPVETKRGKVPNVPQRCYEPERVQLMAQGLLLRQQGYHCDHGVLYFAGSRTRVDVLFDEALEQRTREIIEQARAAMGAIVAPPPLDDSPKCNGCSLAGICLPDETLLMQRRDRSPEALQRTDGDIRRFFPAHEDAQPLYVQEQGARVCKTSKALVIWKQKEKLGTVRLADVSQLVLCGNISITAQTLHLLCQEDVPVLHLSMGGWFYGITSGLGLKNVTLRAAQFRRADDPTQSLALARQIVAAKVNAQRTLARRNAAGIAQRDLDDLADLARRATGAERAEALLGIEGLAAKTYFANFGRMFKNGTLGTDWDFTARNRRPPKDPVNALLSYGYALLVKECTVALAAEGFDPFWGFYHKPRPGRPALALDLMEEFRTPVVDSAVITAINTAMVRPSDFEVAKAGCAMKPGARKAFIQAYENRLDQLVTHPVFDYRCSWRTIIKLQARLLARWVRGEVEHYVGMETR